MDQNNIFFIFKKLFLISAHQNDSKHKKKINFLETRVDRVSNRHLGPDCKITWTLTNIKREQEE
jgi:hypothetical protein